MKPILVREKPVLGSTISVDGDEYKHFPNPWHYHPELELALVKKSYGQRHIGDSIENFGVGDLVLVGSNLPHVWKNDDSYFNNNSKQVAQATVIKFMPDFTGKDMLNLPEMQQIKILIQEKSQRGVLLCGDLRDRVEDMLVNFVNLDYSARMIQLINILDIISKSDSYELLTSENYQKEKTQDAQRLNKVLDYITTHYQDELTLEQIAEQVNMNKNAFCRFFKKRTRKTLFTIINEVRIAKACQLLVETNMDVLQICYSSGYNNISNFNKTFKKIRGISPLTYKRIMKKK